MEQGSLQHSMVMRFSVLLFFNLGVENSVDDEWNRF